MTYRALRMWNFLGYPSRHGIAQVSIQEYAKQFLDSPYQWSAGDPYVETIGAFLREAAAGGDVEEIVARMMAFSAAEFQRSYWAFCAYMETRPGVHVY